MASFIERLHAVVDELTAPLVARHRENLACKEGCSACCVDDLTVFRIEAERIQERYPDVLASETPHPEGACAFLDGAGRCRVYEARPYVCRTQGLPLRWLAEDEDTGDIVEARDVCPKNFEGVPIEGLDADATWTLGPFEQRMADHQHERDGGERVALRSLFMQPSRKRLPVVR